MPKDYSEILTDIRKIVRSINLESKKIQKDFGISIPQLLCLSFLSKCEDYQSTHKELTRYLHLNSSTVTGIVNRLELKRYIARLPKMQDKRVTYIALTSQGKQILESTPDLLHVKLSKKLDLLSQNKIEQLKESLLTLVNAFGIEEVDASPMITIEEPITPKSAE